MPIHDEFGFPTDSPRRKFRRNRSVAIAAMAIMVAALDVWCLIQNLGNSVFQPLLITVAVVFAVIAGGALGLRSSRNAITVAAISLAIVTGLCVMIYTVFEFSPRRPEAAIVAKDKESAPGETGTEIIDTLEKTGVLSESEAARLRKGREEKQALRWGPPPTNPVAP